MLDAEEPVADDVEPPRVHQTLISVKCSRVNSEVGRRMIYIVGDSEAASFFTRTPRKGFEIQRD